MVKSSDQFRILKPPSSVNRKTEAGVWSFWMKALRISPAEVPETAAWGLRILSLYDGDLLPPEPAY